MSSGNPLDESALYLRPAESGQGDAWSQATARQGRVGSQQLLHAGEVSAPPRVAASLGLDPGSAVVVRRRLVLLDGAPAELTDSYFPLTVASGTALAYPRKIKGGAVSLLANLGYVARSSREDVTARPPSPDEASALAIHPGEWVLDVYRVVVDARGEPFEVTTMTMPARERTLHYTVEIG
ncbi:UTRA domain-containing protein [Kitasatospora camelliae]|uniref:UTRA domain-containing protein n=1 Tax=Kitasatospora camelliae TaxID=3156397 RepID=A0AAU8K4H4_9ACTN